MKRFAKYVAVLFLLTAMAGASEIQFVDTYDNALKIAGEHHQKILITFRSPT